jgi:S1-C subfamily serine protease
LKENIYIGNDVFKIGCGGDSFVTPPRMDKGIVTSIINLGNNSKIIRTSAFTIPGDSGGPLYHDNKLVGLIRAIRLLNGKVLAYKISFAVSIDILPLLNKETNNALAFIYNDEYEMPVIPAYRLKFDRYERIIDL